MSQLRRRAPRTVAILTQTCTAAGVESASSEGIVTSDEINVDKDDHSQLVRDKRWIYAEGKVVESNVRAEVPELMSHYMPPVNLIMTLAADIVHPIAPH